MKKQYTLKTLPYGAVIKYKRRIYFKYEGLDHDVLQPPRDMWLNIDDLNWKKFKILFLPK